MKPLFAISWKRPIEDDDIYAPLYGLRCKENTESFMKQWELELKKSNPSLLRVMVKLYVFKVFSIGMMFSLGEAIAR